MLPGRFCFCYPGLLPPSRPTGPGHAALPGRSVLLLAGQRPSAGRGPQFNITPGQYFPQIAICPPGRWTQASSARRFSIFARPARLQQFQVSSPPRASRLLALGPFPAAPAVQRLFQPGRWRSARLQAGTSHQFPGRAGPFARPGILHHCLCFPGRLFIHSSHSS